MDKGGTYSAEDARSERGAAVSGLLRKLALVVPLALLALYAIGFASALPESKGYEGLVRRTDFIATLTGALVIRDGDGSRLYDLPTQHAAQERVRAPYWTLDANALLPYNHLPFEALLVVPLMSLPYSAVFTLWSLLMAAALFLALWLMQRVTPVPRTVLSIVVLAAVSYQPVFRSFLLGQNSPLVLLGLCGTYAALKSGREGLAGVALVLVALKPQVLPVVLLLLLLQARWKTLGAFVAVLAGMSVAAMVPLGVAWPVEYARLLLGVASWQDTGAIDPAIMHNWRGFATDTVGLLSGALVTPLYALLSLASVGLLLWAWLGMRARPVAGARSWGAQDDLLWAAAGLLAMLTSLHSNPHDLTLALFPAWIVAAHAVGGEWAQNSARWWLVALWGGYALIPLVFYGDTGASSPGLAVVPNVLLMALLAFMLARRAKTEGAQTAR